MFRREFFTKCLGVLAGLVGVKAAAKEKPFLTLKGKRGSGLVMLPEKVEYVPLPPFVCVQCYAKSLPTNGDPSLHMTVTHMMDSDILNGGMLRTYWCTQHAPSGSTRFMDEKEGK